MKAVAGLILLSLLVLPAQGLAFSPPAILPQAMMPAVMMPAAPLRQDLDPGYWQRSVLPQMGIATYYAPGLMDYVVDYRTSRGQLSKCEDCVGAVALLRAGDIGRKVWLQPPNGELAGPFLVVDCARFEDIPPLLDRNWAVDVSYELGQTWGLNGPLDGVIVWPDPAEGNEPAPAAQPTQFYIDPSAVVITAPTPQGAASAAGARTVPLPTRLPAPRGTQAVPGPGVSGAANPTAGPPPLTPVITTPTPPGYRATQAVPQPTAPALTPGAAAGAQAGAPTPAEPRVALGRPGQELLLAAARPALAAPTLTATATSAATLAPPTLAPAPTPILTSPPILPTASPAPAPPVAPQGSLVQRLWRAILGFFGR